MRAPHPVARSLTVLVVDDNHAGADALSRLLDLCGYCCRVAYDGTDALAQLDGGGVDVLVLDLDMAWTGCFELLRQLDGLPGDPLLVALSATATDDECREAQRAGFDHILLKPLDPDELLPLFEEHAGRGWATSASSG